MEAKQVLWCHLELASRQWSREKDGQRTLAAAHVLLVGEFDSIRKPKQELHRDAEAIPRAKAVPAAVPRAVVCAAHSVASTSRSTGCWSSARLHRSGPSGVWSGLA